VQHIDNKVIKRIRGWGCGSVFTPNMFFDLGTRASIDKILSRFTQKGIIRRLSRGVYNLPKKHPVIGKLSPSPEAVAKAILGRDASKILPSGAYAANLLGLSTQIPAQIVFLTDGDSRTVRIENITIKLRHTTPKNMAVAGRVSGIVIQALKYFGKENVDTILIEKLKNILSSEDKVQLIKDFKFAPIWIVKIMSQIAEKDRNE